MEMDKYIQSRGTAVDLSIMMRGKKAQLMCEICVHEYRPNSANTDYTQFPLFGVWEKKVTHSDEAHANTVRNAEMEPSQRAVMCTQH